MFDGPHFPRSGRLRLAIISTYDEMCGIAGYTRALEQQLRTHADVTVLDLDQYLLRSPHRRVQQLADQHIKQMAAGLKDYDAVNIQLEYGTLGRTQKQIVRRLRVLARAAPVLSVTFHTVLGHDALDWSQLGVSLITGRLNRAAQTIGNWRRGRGIAGLTYALLRSLQRSKHVHAIVHTKRDARLLHDVYGIDNVDHHPLSFVGADQADMTRQATARDHFPAIRTLPADAKLIGSFGFLSPYKGFETALRALRYLPDDHHLLIFGGIHPQSIKRNQSLDPYIQTLLDEAHIGQTILDTVGETKSSIALNLDLEARDLLVRHPEDLQHRVHFMGVHDDEGFMRAMALCNMVVLPYLEVGQSSSGPIAMALEMGCRVLASRTLAFLQDARYHPGQVEFFDIGNYAELADLILAERSAPNGARELAFNTATNTAMYLRANELKSEQCRPRTTRRVIAVTEAGSVT